VSRYHQLRVDLEHCRERVRYAQRQLEDYTLTADLSTELAPTTLRKLADDLAGARWHPQPTKRTRWPDGL